MSQGFNAMGKPIPNTRKQASYDLLKEFGLSTDSSLECVSNVSDLLERDKPFEAMEVARKYVDLTGAYRLTATLLTNSVEN